MPLLKLSEKDTIELRFKLHDRVSCKCGGAWATGVVVGSTAVLGSDLYCLHGVTLGATGKPTFGAKRHPTVGRACVLGAGATVLGDVAVGDGATVGAGAIVTRDVPAGSTFVGVNKLVEKPPPAAADGGEEVDPFSWFYDI